MNSRKIQTISLVLMASILSACGSMRNGGAPDPSFDINTDLEKISKEFESATNISNFYQTAAADRKDARNRFISGRLVQMDLQYLRFIKSLTSDKQQLDAATDIAGMTLNLAGTLVGTVQAKTNLAAAAAGLGGAKTTIDKDFYYEKSINALVATMNAKRKEVLVGILTGLSSPIDQYPFERALTDLQEYYLAGTLNGAIQFINVQAAQNEAGSNKTLNVLYQLSIPTPTQIIDIGRLTDAIGVKDLTLANANAALTALGVDSSQLPTDLEDGNGKDGARQMLKKQVRKAKNLADDGARAAAIKNLSDAFKTAGILK